MRLEGSYVALITPFKNDAVDYDALGRIVAMHVENGTKGLVPCGTTGESPSLSYEEHKEVIAFVIRESAGKIPVIAGTGANSTHEAIELTLAAAQAGADACLLVSPYYNKPEPDGMFAHFKAIADATRLPIVLYNIPSRTGREIALETIFRLADEVPEVIGIKEAGGSMDRVTEICRRTGLSVLSGDDSLTLPIISVGGAGIISVLSNIIPRDVSEMTEAALRGDFESAKEAHFKMFPLFKACFLETNPIPVKTAMALLGMCTPELRLPLSPMRQAARQSLELAMSDYGLLSSQGA